MKLMNKDRLSKSPKTSSSMSIKYNDDGVSGVQTFNNGDVYTGEFLDGKKHGQGVLTTKSNRMYKGGWKNDVPHGAGINSFPNGKTYEGEYKDGKPIGEGKWIYSDGRTYSGKWINGQFINENNKNDTLEFRIATFAINIVVIGFMVSVVVYWLMKVLKIL